MTSSMTTTAGQFLSLRRLTMAAAVALISTAALATESLQGVGSLANPDQRGTARVMGMNASYVGVAEGADALQWNPAGLGHLNAAEAGWHHLSGLGSAIGESIILGSPVGNLGGLAISADLLDNGSFETRDALGNVIGTYDARTIGGSLGWGYALMDQLAIGATVRGARQTLAATHYDSFAGDVGVLWTALPSLTFGVAADNLGSSGSTSNLAMGINAGASWAQALGANNHLLLAAATEIQPGGLSHVNLGAEDLLMSRLSLRAGYRLNFTDQKLTGLTGLTAGAGILFSHLALDYAFVPFGELGALHRVSLTYRHAAGARAPVADAAGADAAGPTVYDVTACGFECGMESPDVLLVTLVDDKTRFDFDAVDVTPEGRIRLQRLADVLNRFPQSTLRIDGYSDSLGTAEVKQRVSQRRADRAAATLQQMGIAAARFEAVVGRSDTHPIVDNASNAGRSANRRVELRVHRVGLTNGAAVAAPGSVPPTAAR